MATASLPHHPCIDCDALPLIHVMQLAIGLGFAIHQDGTGRVHFVRDLSQQPNQVLLRALQLPTLRRGPV